MEGAAESLAALRTELEGARSERDKLGPGVGRKLARPSDIRKLPEPDQLIAWRRLLSDTNCVIEVMPSVAGRTWDDNRIRVTFDA
jgi:hypothetical protein